MTDLDKVKRMEELNWKPASQYWCEQYHIKRKKLDEAADEIERLREALREVIDEFEVCVRTECGSVVASSDEYQPISILFARAALEESK